MTSGEGVSSLKVNMLFRVDEVDNGTLIATVLEHHTREPDGLGALYYVIVIIGIYGCSILLMIGSHMKKNNLDRRLNRLV